MQNSEILRACDNGQPIKYIPKEELSKKIQGYTVACTNYGPKFEDWNYTFLADRLKSGFPGLTDVELSLVLVSAMEGRFQKKATVSVKPVHYFEWINEYIPKRAKAMEMFNQQFNLSDLSKSANLNETPYGIAMKFKHDTYEALRDAKTPQATLDKFWEKIPLKELAMAIKDKPNITKKELMTMFDI